MGDARSVSARRYTLLLTAGWGLLAIGGCARPDPAPWQAQADRARAQNDFAGAVSPLRHLVEIQPQDPRRLQDLGEAVRRSGQRVPLRAQAQADLQKNPDDIGALVILAAALTDRIVDKDRIACLRRLTRLCPDALEFQTSLALSLVYAHLYGEARPLLDRLAAVQPESALVFLLRGQVFASDPSAPESLARAEADLKKAIALNPQSGTAYLLLGDVYRKRKQPRQAVDALIEAARRMPEKPDVHFALAGAFREAGNLAMAQKARAQFLRLRQEEDQLNALEKRCTAFPDDYELHLRTARGFLRRGDMDRAGHFVSRLLEIRPDDPRSKEAAREMDALAQEAAGGAP